MNALFFFFLENHASLDLGLVAHNPNYVLVWVVPARTRKRFLPALIVCLAAQRNLAGAKLDPSSFSVIVLVEQLQRFHSFSLASICGRQFPPAPISTIGPFGGPG